MESTVTGDDIFVDVVTSSTLHPTIKIERRNTEDSDIDEEEEILRRALSSPGTRIRVTQRKNGHPFSTENKNNNKKCYVPVIVFAAALLLFKTCVGVHVLALHVEAVPAAAA